MQYDVTVVGSVNIDYVFNVVEFPKPGETVPGSISYHPGGKGANQAVAVARLGGRAALVAKIGQDPFSQQMLRSLGEEGVDTRHIGVSARQGGAAGIWVNSRGENSIVIAGGANSSLSSDDVDNASELLKGSKVVLAQLEIPLATVVRALQLARSQGVITVLDPAPAQHLSDQLLAQVDVITPNAQEASQLTGIDVHCWKTAALAARELRLRGVKSVLVTMGKFGALCATAEGNVRISVPRVKVIDTTAAGDAFAGALALALARGVAPDGAADVAAAAGALAVTVAGARPSLPRLEELQGVVKLPWH